MWSPPRGHRCAARRPAMVRNQLLRSACSESAGFRARYQGSVGLPEYSVLGFRERGRRGRRAKRLQDKFGSRWNMKTTVTVSAGQNGSPARPPPTMRFPASPIGPVPGLHADRGGGAPSRSFGPARCPEGLTKRASAALRWTFRGTGSAGQASSRGTGTWPCGPRTTPTDRRVIVNIESPVLEEIVKHHQS